MSIGSALLAPFKRLRRRPPAGHAQEDVEQHGSLYGPAAPSETIEPGRMARTGYGGTDTSPPGVGYGLGPRYE